MRNARQQPQPQKPERVVAKAQPVNPNAMGLENGRQSKEDFVDYLDQRLIRVEKGHQNLLEISDGLLTKLNDLTSRVDYNASYLGGVTEGISEKLDSVIAEHQMRSNNTKSELIDVQAVEEDAYRDGRMMAAARLARHVFSIISYVDHRDIDQPDYVGLLHATMGALSDILNDQDSFAEVDSTDADADEEDQTTLDQ